MEPAPRVAVFGSSTVREDDPGYRLALELGAALGRRGATVVTGGYGGVMEAASRGAAEAGGHVIGITVESFAGRGVGNRWVAERVHAPDLVDRLRRLVTATDAQVAVEPSLGTLAELFLAWTLASTGAVPDGSLVLLGPRWPSYLEAHRGVVAEEHFRHLRIAASPLEAAELALAAATRARSRAAR
jgi:uncharacterized protein (TIGR00730 family)